MEMKNRILDYMEASSISVAELSDSLQIETEKLKKGNKADWDAQDLLKICAYLEIDPMEFYARKQKRK
ncbi:MAG: helix-turn-helix domain-containing protein [Lachnospiraceae bacterium]|nr:helix-turn-helix domain-containing protein [Lachnospiraceae bacterium]